MRGLAPLDLGEREHVGRPIDAPKGAVERLQGGVSRQEDRYLRVRNAGSPEGARRSPSELAGRPGGQRKPHGRIDTDGGPHQSGPDGVPRPPEAYKTTSTLSAVAASKI